MIVKFIANRGVMQILSESDTQSGTTLQLSAGAHKITFIRAYSDANYDLNINCYDSNGNKTGYVRGILEADGFNIVLSYDSIVTYIVNKSS